MMVENVKSVELRLEPGYVRGRCYSMPVLAVNVSGYTEPGRVRGRCYSMPVPISRLGNEITCIYML